MSMYVMHPVVLAPSVRSVLWCSDLVSDDTHTVHSRRQHNKTCEITAFRLPSNLQQTEQFMGRLFIRKYCAHNIYIHAQATAQENTLI